MDKQKLKELMRNQIQTIDGDVQKKIEYLTNGDLFNYNYYKIDIYRQKLNFTKDNDLLDAFIGKTDNSTPNDENTFANAFMKANSDGGIMPSQKRSTEDLSAGERIKRLNERIAALRGTSMPGGYLHNSN